MRSHHTSVRRLLATACAGAVLLSCSSGPDEQLEASVETPEPSVEPSPSEEPTEEASVSASPEPEASEAEDPPPIGDDEPLFAPLPELTPDTDNEVPDDLEQVILDAYADAYQVAYHGYATSELAEAELHRTHSGEALEVVESTLENLRRQNAVELSPDTVIDRVWIKEAAGGVAVVRQCFSTGPRTGMYDKKTNELLQSAPAGTFARDRLLELVRLPEEKEPRYRVTRSEPAGTELCP